VFCTALGGELLAGNVRRTFRRLTGKAGIGDDWTPRELRHSFVSLLSSSGVRIEDIADLCGHAGTRVTEACTATSSAQSCWTARSPWIRSSTPGRAGSGGLSVRRLPRSPPSLLRTLHAIEQRRTVVVADGRQVQLERILRNLEPLLGGRQDAC